MKIIRYILLCFIISAIIISCGDDVCNSETNSFLKTEFIVQDPDLISIKYLDSLSIYSPLWQDSIHYKEEGLEKSLSFTLSPESDTTEIVFTSKQAASKDTIYIYYQREFIFLSPECGFVINYTIDTVLNTYNYIDSLEVLNYKISTNKNGHIKIYF